MNIGFDIGADCGLMKLEAVPELILSDLKTNFPCASQLLWLADLFILCDSFRESLIPNVRLSLLLRQSDSNQPSFGWCAAIPVFVAGNYAS